MDRAQVDRWCEWGAAGLVLAILIYSPLAFGAIRMQEFVGVQWLTAVLLLVWLVRFRVNPSHRLRWPPVCWAVLAFMAYAVGRYATADIEYVARQEMIRVLIYGFLFFAILNNVRRPETTQIIGVTLVFLATLIALYGLYQYLGNSDHVLHLPKPELYGKRASGTFICPNHFAGYLEMLLPLAMAYTLTARFSYVMKVLLAYASIMIFAGILASVSRGAWVACALSLVAVFTWLLRQRAYRLRAVLIASGLALTAVVFVAKARISPQRFDALRQAVAVSDIRILLWPSATQMWRDHFWWGVGPAHFDWRYPPYRLAEYDLQARPERVHNDYLNTLVDWGLVGAVLVATAWGLFYWDVFRSWKQVYRTQDPLAVKPDNRSALVMGSVTGLLAILFHSFTDFNMHVPSNAILAVTFMAVVSGHCRDATAGETDGGRWSIRWVAALVLAAGIAYLGWEACQRTREEAWLQRAAKATKYSIEQEQALKKAFATEPGNFQTAYDIGEVFRLRSWEGKENYREEAERAMGWYRNCIRLNPFHVEAFIRQGMCLDWLGRPAEALSLFQRALALDPNGFFTLAHVGWHYVQVEDYAAAEKYLDLSCRLFPISRNPVAASYLKIARERLAERARAKQP